MMYDDPIDPWTFGVSVIGVLGFLSALTWVSWNLARHGWNSRGTWPGKTQFVLGSTLFTATTGVWGWIAVVVLGLR